MKVAQKNLSAVLTKNRMLCVGLEEVKQLWCVFLQVKLYSLSQHWRKGASECYNDPLLSPSFTPTTNIYLALLCAEDTKISKTKDMVGGIYPCSYPISRVEKLATKSVCLTLKMNFFPLVNNKSARVFCYLLFSLSSRIFLQRLMLFL